MYGVKYYKSFRGETLGYTRFQGELCLSALRYCVDILFDLVCSFYYCCFSYLEGQIVL